MKHILPIILLFPFALQAMSGDTSAANIEQAQKKTAYRIVLQARLDNTRNEWAEQTSYFPAQDGKLVNPVLPSTKVLTVSGATATVKVTAINENAANIECTLQYMHTTRLARLLSCFAHQNTEETVTRTVTVDMGEETHLEFGNSTYPQSKKSSQVIPLGSEYLAGLQLRMWKN
jgi:hypothetical protein